MTDMNKIKNDAISSVIQIGHYRRTRHARELQSLGS